MNSESALKDPYHDAWKFFIFAHSRLLDRINKEVTAAGHLPLDWYDVLLSLDKAPDQRLRMTELADDVLLSKSGLTRMVDRVEKAGYLRREQCPSDRRGCFAVLTEEGEKALRSTWPLYSKAIVDYFASHMSEEEAETLIRVFSRMLTPGDYKIPQ